MGLTKNINKALNPIGVEVLENSILVESNKQYRLTTIAKMELISGVQVVVGTHALSIKDESGNVVHESSLTLTGGYMNNNPQVWINPSKSNYVMWNHSYKFSSETPDSVSIAGQNYAADVQTINDYLIEVENYSQVISRSGQTREGVFKAYKKELKTFWIKPTTSTQDLTFHNKSNSISLLRFTHTRLNWMAIKKWTKLLSRAFLET